MKRVAVIGASLAGLRSVEALRRLGHDGEIAWVGAEKHLPYDRPPLSKQVLEGRWGSERLFLRQNYDELEVEFHLGRSAARLDERFVELDDGRRVEFDGLVVATGASPRQLPDGRDLEGVFTLRSLDDALAIEKKMQRGPRVAIVGAGFIGLEVAACCRTRGLEVTVIESAAVPLGQAIGEVLGQCVADLHRSRGVDLRCGRTVTGVEGTERVSGVRLDDGSLIAADLLVVGIGVKPNTDWLDGSGVDVDDGVVCDATCQTSRPDVVAAGDVARWHHELFDESVRVEHWTNAAEQADAAVRRLLEPEAEKKPFVSVPYFWSDQYDTKMQMAGRYRPGDEMRWVERPEDASGDDKPRLVALFGRGGRLTGALTLNRPAKLVRYRRAIAERVSLDDAL